VFFSLPFLGCVVGAVLGQLHRDREERLREPVSLQHELAQPPAAAAP
jgi:hypothetical protein